MGVKSQAQERLGQRFISNEGCEFIIVEYNGTHDIWVEFQDEYKAKVHTRYDKCKNGKIKNPYYPSICGVGCLGLNSDGSKPIARIKNGKPTREYNLWKHMIERCYSEKYQHDRPTYIGCIVCCRWLVYANFLEDLPLIENYELWINNPGKISLDKDLKQVGVGNKVYSLETVKFVTIGENTMEMIERTKQKKPVICLETQQVFNSIRDAEEWCHGDVSQHLRGKRSTAGGLHWQYLDDYKRQLRLQTDIRNSRLIA